jgi:hypothetical protein
MIIDARQGCPPYVIRDANGVELEHLVSCNTATGEICRFKLNPDGSFARFPQYTDALIEERLYVPAPLQVFLNDRRVF